MTSPAFWLRYSLRSLHRSGRRALFALLCIGVGVGSVVALQLASLTVQSALTSNIRAANGGDISIAADASPVSGQDLAIFRQLQRQGQITSWTAVSSLHATTITQAGQLIPFSVDVVSSPPYPLGGEPSFVAPSNGQVEGLLRRHGDVLLTSVLADELSVHIGDRLTVNGVGGTGLHARVQGIVAESSFSHAAVMTMQRSDAAAVSSAAPQYTEIFANVPGSSNAVAAVLRQHFPVAQIQTVQQALNDAQAQVHDFRQFMLLVGLLALAIAGVGILNAMQSILAWRKLEIAVLKSIGYPQRTLYVLFGLEAVLLGLLGGVIGTVAGALGSKVVTDALARALGVQVAFQLDAGTLASGIALGIGATLIFAVLPIVRAAHFRPLEILREGGMSRAEGVPQTIGLLALVLLLFAALASAILGNPTFAFEFVVGACVAFGFLTGIFAVVIEWISRLGPATSRARGIGIFLILAILAFVAIRRQPALAAVFILGAILWGATLLPHNRIFPLLIAARSLGRRRARTSVTLVAFLVGILSMSITLTVALSLQSQIASALASNSSANLVAVASPSSEASVLRASRKLSGVTHTEIVTTVTTSPVAVNGRSVSSILGPDPVGTRGFRGERDRGEELGGITGVNLRRGDRPANVAVVAGRGLSGQDAGSNNVLLLSQLQDPPWNIAVGDTVTLRESGIGTTKVLHVVGFYDRARRRTFGSFFTGPVYGDRGMAIALGKGDAQSVISFSVAPDKLTQDAAILQRSVPGILVVDVGDLTRIIQTVLGELLNLLTVVTAIALGAGLAVVGNGVTLAMLERRREIALLKAIGFGPRSVLQFVLVENALIGTLAGAVSVIAVVFALGLFSRLSLQRAIGFDPVVATLTLLLAAALAIVTAYITARGPVKIRPIEALRNE
jgi:putative ABC transport system permease protein